MVVYALQSGGEYHEYGWSAPIDGTELPVERECNPRDASVIELSCLVTAFLFYS